MAGVGDGQMTLHWVLSVGPDPLRRSLLGAERATQRGHLTCKDPQNQQDINNNQPLIAPACTPVTSDSVSARCVRMLGDDSIWRPRPGSQAVINMPLNYTKVTKGCLSESYGQFMGYDPIFD